MTAAANVVHGIPVIVAAARRQHPCWCKGHSSCSSYHHNWCSKYRHTLICSHIFVGAGAAAVTKLAAGMAVIVACKAGNETVAAVIVGVVCVFVMGVAV